MKLKDYLHFNEISLTRFSEQINYDFHYISKIKNRQKKPGIKLAKIIEKATQGMVTIRELMEIKEK